MDFLIRFVQIHGTFRKPEIEALAVLADVNVEFLLYIESVCLEFYRYISSCQTRIYESPCLICIVSILSSPLER